MQALVKALGEFPQFNATFDDEAGVIHQHAGVHVGIATQTVPGPTLTPGVWSHVALSIAREGVRTSPKSGEAWWLLAEATSETDDVREAPALVMAEALLAHQRKAYERSVQNVIGPMRTTSAASDAAQQVGVGPVQIDAVPIHVAFFPSFG